MLLVFDLALLLLAGGVLRYSGFGRMTYLGSQNYRDVIQDATFWNKGTEAQIDWLGVKLTCQVRSPAAAK